MKWMKNMEFRKLRAWIESWGLTPSEESSIPYPSVYSRMIDDSPNEKVMLFIQSITDTVDGHSYLVPESWEEIENLWNEK